MKRNSVHNPDVLSCLANLSNDEVFTPPEVVNDMLDLLPPKLFRSPDTKFLDPCTKSGVFLREIAKRLIAGLADEIPDLQERIDHIMHHQLYGVAITEMTALLARRSLYCSKDAQGKFSVSAFDTREGNIRFNPIQHTWKDDRCVYCGASRSQFDRGDELESHAYEFIHISNPKDLFNMKFDVIIGNPPYQLKDGGGTGESAKPIYQDFVSQAKKLAPHFLSMIIPARWFAGGKGLDGFRAEMLADKSIKHLVDYENYKEVFSGLGGLAGGVCYFLWDRNYFGKCTVVNVSGEDRVAVVRDLNEYDTFIRSNRAIRIVDKIMKLGYSKKLSDVVYPRMPFGIATTYVPLLRGTPCYFTQKMGICFVRKSDIKDTFGIINKWKFLVPKAPIAGQTDFTKAVGFYYEGNVRLAKPGEICSESWLVAGAFDTEREAIAYKSYIFTKTVRFLLLQTVVSQNITKKNFCFIPDLGVYKGHYTDELLCKMWNITDEEWNYIDSRIGNIGGH